ATAEQVQLRSFTASGWTEWISVDGEPAEGPDANSPEWRGRTAVGPIWVGHGVQRVQFRVVGGQLPHLRLHAIRSELAGGGVLPAARAGASPQPGIITRAQWGADESWRKYAPGCDGTVSYADNV